MKGFILLISGPSGAGKSTLLKRLFEEFEDELYFSISSTTRMPRNDEIDGVHYYFISQEEFQNGIEKGIFLEWARVHGNFYGTSLEHTNKALDEGKVVVFDIDVQGFKIARKSLGEKINSIFITTKSKAELKKRLLKRNTDTMAQFEKRLQNASEEMRELGEYDFLIINDDLERSYETLRSIYLSLKHRTKRQDLEKIQNLWNEGV